MYFRRKKKSIFYSYSIREMGGGGELFLGLVLFNETVNNAALFLNHKVFKVEPTNT